MVSNIMYHLISFADYSNLRYSNDNLQLLTKHPSFSNYLKTPVTEVDALGNPVHQGIVMVRGNTFPLLNITSQKIEVVKGANRREGFYPEEVEQVEDELLRLLTDLYDCFPEILQDSNRLALVTEYMYFDCSDDEMNRFRMRFLKPLHFYKDNSTTEFDVKYAGVETFDISGSKEKVNAITTISRWFRGQGSGMIFEVDGFHLVIDVNTIVDNKRNRFNGKHFKEFIGKADSVQKAIAREVFENVS